jgi:aminoglycoside 6'-N-acetyltransferase
MSRLALRLRRARAADLPTLEAWDRDPAVIASGVDGDAWGWPRELRRNPPWRAMLMAELWGRPVGFVQIIDPCREESRYWGRVPASLRALDLWIGAAADRGRGLGARMMRLALDRCRAGGARAVLIDPLARNRAALRFYRRMGFRPVGRRRFGRDDCLVLRARP